VRLVLAVLLLVVVWLAVKEEDIVLVKEEVMVFVRLGV
jgi:hypothetical protein